MERKCERPRRMIVVENGILKYMPSASIIRIPNEVRVICGPKEEDDAINKRYGKEPVFYNCFINNKKIIEVICPDSVEVIGDKAFEHCSSLTKFCFSNTENKSLKRIGMSAFLGCVSMQKITLPNSLEEITGWAFADIPNLTIQFEGTLEEWNKIKKYDEWAAKNTLVFTKDNPDEPIIIKGKQ